jgi:phosphatidate cytidylyltransferase
VITRIVVGVAGLAVLLPAIIFGGQLAVEAIVVLVLLICVTEYAGMAFKDDVFVASGWLFFGVALTYGSAVYAPKWLSIAMMAVTIGTMLFVTLRPPPELSRAADNAGRYVLGISWMSMLAAFPLLRELDSGLSWVFLVLTISWLGDTGAYFAGRSLGKTKLYPLISPKKTWEGVVGGVVAATIGTFIVRQFNPALSVVDCLVLGPTLCLAGVLGDLSESMLKRAFGVKDAGSIMPGHGGMLDRIDSVLFVGPLLYGYAVLVMDVS